jgi:hypothetical protein
MDDRTIAPAPAVCTSCVVVSPVRTPAGLVPVPVRNCVA